MDVDGCRSCPPLPETGDSLHESLFKVHHCSIDHLLGYGNNIEYDLYLVTMLHSAAAPIVPVVIPVAVNPDYYITLPQNQTGAPGL